MITMNRARKFFALIALGTVCLSAIAAEPGASPSPAASPAESPAPTITQSVTDISAQRAAAERSKIYRAGRAYGEWLDQIAKDSGSAFLQQPVFERVTWMRLLSCGAVLALIAAIAGGFVWIVRRRAGEIQSNRYQSALALTASAIRKPFAFFLWMCGGAFALMPIAIGIIGRPTRVFWLRILTAIFYAGWIIALLWLVFRAILAIEKRMRMWAERTNSLIGKVTIPILGHTLRMLVPLLGVILLLPLLKLPEDWAWVTQKGFGILLIVAFSVLIVRGVNAVQSALMSRNRLDVPDNLSARRIYTQVSVIRKIIVTGVVIIATGSILMLFDPVRQFGTSILASAGIAGIVIGFAAQKTLGNVLAGIQIALTQPILARRRGGGRRRVRTSRRDHAHLRHRADVGFAANDFADHVFRRETVSELEPRFDRVARDGDSLSRLSGSDGRVAQRIETAGRGQSEVGQKSLRTTNDRRQARECRSARVGQRRGRGQVGRSPLRGPRRFDQLSRAQLSREFAALPQHECRR